MNRTRNGRIARLPQNIRTQLNRRIDEGHQGKDIVAWLNQLPEVTAMTAADYSGKPLRAQNLSEWRKGGYLDWLARQEALEVAERLGEEAAEWEGIDRPPLTDTLAVWAAARYAVATRRIAAADEAESWHLLRDLCRDLVELRRGDHSAARLRIERDRLELERERTRERTEEELWEWAMQPDNRERICKGHLSGATNVAMLRNLMFGTAPERQGGNAECACQRADFTEAE